MRLRYLILGILLIISVNAIGIGLTPAKINITDMLRGGYAEYSIKITTDSKEELLVEREMIDSDIEGWLSFSPSKNLTVSKDEPLKIKVMVEAPVDVRNGRYKGTVLFRTRPSNNARTITGSKIVTGVASLILVEIVDKEKIECHSITAGIGSVEKGETALAEINVENKGNVRVTPHITLDIWDGTQDTIIKTVKYGSTEVRPTQRIDIPIEIATGDMYVGQYFAELYIDSCTVEKTVLPFEVMEIGTSSVRGEILEIRNKVWNYVGETIPVEIKFRNTGERDYNAKFQGKVTLDEDIIELVQTDPKIVRAGEEAVFTVHFKPKNSGRFMLTGSVAYENKLSFEKSSIINVNPQGFDPVTGQFIKESPKTGLIAAYAIISFVIILIIYNIIRKRPRKLSF